MALERLHLNMWQQGERRPPEAEHEAPKEPPKSLEVVLLRLRYHVGLIGLKPRLHPHHLYPEQSQPRFSYIQNLLPE